MVADTDEPRPRDAGGTVDHHVPRIDIELTSSRRDGSWTWRAAGAREPQGVVDASVLPGRAEDRRRVQGRGRAGDRRHHYSLGRHQTAEGRSQVDARAAAPAATVRAGRPAACRARQDETAPSAAAATPGPWRGADGADRGEHPIATRVAPATSPPTTPLGDRPEHAAPTTERPDRGERRGPRPERSRPDFTPPPELPQRPKPKRLRPGKAQRNAFSTRFPRSSARSPSWPCWDSRPSVSDFATTTRSCLPKAGRRSRRRAC